MLHLMEPPASAQAESAVEILSVSAPLGLTDEVRGAQLIRPEAGSVTDVFVLDMAGWVIARDGQAQAVEIVSDGMTLRRIPITFPRVGVARALGVPDATPCGFRGLVGALKLSLEFELEFMAVLEDGRRCSIGSMKGRRARPRTSFDPALRPIVLTSLGRTGTVWVMKMLDAHPSIVVQETYPYERWPARYWAHMLKVLSDPADHANSAGVQRFDRDLSHVGHNPFYDRLEAADEELGGWLGRTHVERLASFCMHNIEDWYTIAARRQGKTPVYFAEKNFLRMHAPAELVSELYPDPREVFLVRDFRDMACSWISFHGDRPFGAEHGVTGILQDNLEPLAHRLASNWRSRGDRAHLVRYEDLVFEPRETLGSLLDYLEIDSSDAIVEQLMRAGSDADVFDLHGTSGDLEKSVGRWRHEGDQAFRAYLNDTFRKPLIEFGYID
jgi:hypothetical protein